MGLMEVIHQWPVSSHVIQALPGKIQGFPHCILHPKRERSSSDSYQPDYSNFRLQSNLAVQQFPLKCVNELRMEDVQKFMGEQFDPKRFVVRERYKLWADLKQKPG